MSGWIEGETVVAAAIYSGPNGARCWKLLEDGTMEEITNTVIPEQARHRGEKK